MEIKKNIMKGEIDFMNEKFSFTISYTGVNAIAVPILAAFGLYYVLKSGAKKMDKYAKQFTNRKNK